MAQTKTASKTAQKRSPKPPAKKATKKAAKKTTKKAAKKASPKKSARKKAAKPADPVAELPAGEREVTIDRRRPAAQRNAEAAEQPAEAAPKLERREKVNRRRQIDPTTCERDYTDHEVEFMNAMDAYKRRSGRMFPTCSEVLEVIRDLGYVRLSTAELATLNAGRGVTDEPEADAAGDAPVDESPVEEAAEAAASEALAESEELRVD